ncbi:MAG TPA: glycosyltransferase family 2 protein [Longimicrobiales bacterium]|nr:glycosyltransferase family 2 protein [Longimicrobiales bacterium]
MSAIPVSVVILTLNEEQNLPRCLASLAGLVDDIFIVDSGSTDRTLAMARAAGAQVVSHSFAGHSAQWQWALTNLPLRHSWVLGLDADQRLLPELADELRVLFAEPARVAEFAGFYITRRNVFRGRWIRWGGYYPKRFIKLFRRDRIEHEAADLLDHHFRVQGKVGTLEHDIVEENRKEDHIDFWIQKHLRYADLLAQEQVRRREGQSPTTVKPALLGNPDERAEWQKRTWTMLPRFVRAPAYFLWRYLFRLGFLDGKQGFVFHFLHAFWFRLVTDLKIDEYNERHARPRH